MYNIYGAVTHFAQNTHFTHCWGKGILHFCVVLTRTFYFLGMLEPKSCAKCVKCVKWQKFKENALYLLVFVTQSFTHCVKENIYNLNSACVQCVKCVNDTLSFRNHVFSYFTIFTKAQLFTHFLK